MKPSTSRPAAIFLVALAILVMALYFNILDNAPTNWDDPAIFSRTALHEFSLENLKTVLSLHPNSTYQPVRDVSYMLDFALFKDRVVTGMHLHSIALYIGMLCAGWLFLLTLMRMFSDDDQVPLIWASITTLIFAVHPVHVESITWLYARKEPLMGFFSFLSLFFFLRARAGSRPAWIPCGLSLVLAILSKPIALMLPGIMIVLDLLMQPRYPASWKKRACIYLPLLALAIPMLIRLITMMFSAGGIKPWHGGSVGTNLLAVAQIFVSYVQLIGFTVNYSADYPIALHADPHAWQAWAFVAANLALLAAALIALVKKRPLAAFFIAWFYIFLIPVSHLLPISQILADRYALLPSLSWCALLGYALTRLWLHHNRIAAFSAEFPKLLTVAIIAVILFSYAFMTLYQNDIWQNSTTLWEDTLAKYPQSNPANVNLSSIYIKQGRYEEAARLCIEAIKHQPYDYLAISNLALAQMMMQQYEHAIHNFQAALKLKPDLFKSRLALANTYQETGNHHQALELYNQMGAQTATYRPFFLYKSSISLWKTGQRPQALANLDQAAKLAHQNPAILTDIAAVYTSMGESARAAELQAIIDQ